MAQAVLEHIDRELTDEVMGKVAGALRPGGAFLVSVREGEGERWETGESANRYHVVLWPEPDLVERLAAVGLDVEWSKRHRNSEGHRLTMFARLR